jgi:hypothetical protein
LVLNEIRRAVDAQPNVTEVTVSTGTIIAIVVVLVVLAAIAAIASILMRRRASERALSGPEYDRLANEMGPRQARAELGRRRQRVDGLGIRPLTGERQTAYAGQWEEAQEQFIDNPVEAVSSARSLIVAVAADRGYDVTDQNQLLTDLSVYHGRYLDGYRQANRAIAAAGPGRTESLRQALLGYRNFFFDLLDTTSDGGTVSTPSADPGVTNGEVAASQVDGGNVPAQSPWKQVTQGLHWKTQRQEDDATATRR